jgi:hypothetical protein
MAHLTRNSQAVGKVDAVVRWVALGLLACSLPAIGHDTWSVQNYADPVTGMVYREAVIGGQLWQSRDKDLDGKFAPHLFVRCSPVGVIIGLKMDAISGEAQVASARDFVQFRVDDEPMREVPVEASTFWFESSSGVSPLVTELMEGRTLFVRFPQLYFDAEQTATADRVRKTAEFPLAGARRAIRAACAQLPAETTAQG